MNFISASYNMYHNSIDITTFDGYILRIDCNKAEEGLKPPMDRPCIECVGYRQCYSNLNHTSTTKRQLP